MNDVYLTSTLQTNWNRQFNPQLCNSLENKGIRCYLPQRGTDQNEPHVTICQKDLAAIRNAKKLLCVAENESVNWGAEVGYAYGIGKDVIAIMQKDHPIPLIAAGMVIEVVAVEDLNDIVNYIDVLISVIKK